jgi:hypothetical protein
MSKLFLRNWILCITLAVTALGSTSSFPTKVWADSSAVRSDDSDSAGETVSIDVAAELENASDADVASAVKTVSDNTIASAPANATEDQKIQIQEATNTLQLQAQRPGFKARLISFMKKTGHVGGKAILKGVGISGSAALATTIAPLVIGANIISTAMSGKGMVATHSNMISDELNGDPREVFVSELGGAIGELYFLTAIYAIGFTVEAPVFLAAAAERLVQEAVCDKQNQGPDLQSYCKLSNGTFDHIIFASATVGDIVGESVRLSIVLPARFIGKLFHHRKKVTPPTVVVPAQSAENETVAEAPAANE